MYLVANEGDVGFSVCSTAKPFSGFTQRRAHTIRGGFVRFIAQYVSQIPIPSIKPEQKVLIGKIVNQILDTKRTDPDADVSELENEIDQIVYLLYDLTLKKSLLWRKRKMSESRIKQMNRIARIF